MTINIFMHIYIGENAHWDIYAPPWQKHYTIFFSKFLNFFFHFRCILLQISHQKCFFISISIPGRSGGNFDNNCNKDVINAELNNVYSWLCSNRLSLNVEKTKYVSFHTAQKKQ